MTEEREEPPPVAAPIGRARLLSKELSDLFGSDVGRFQGCFDCSHNRIKGRLFATSRAILFYSNLLGFERRIYLLHEDILSIELFRTTSISIRTTECEIYVFKSFSHRIRVLRLLQSLLPSAIAPNQFSLQEESTVCSTPPRTAPPMQNRFATLSVDDSAPHRVVSWRDLRHPEPTNGLRRRAVSDSMVVRNLDTAGYDPSSDGEDYLPEDTVPIEEEAPDVCAWESIVNEQPLPLVGVEKMELPCSLQTFFNMFLAEDAPYSLQRYQSEHVEDRDVKLTSWTSCEDDNGATMMARTMTFVHPIKKKTMGMGPSEASTTRNQRLRKFQEGILLENTTNIEGIPSADCFHVQDRWVVEETSGATIVVTSSFDVVFGKYSIFRGIIDTNVRKETSDWWLGYMAYVQNALGHQSKDIAQPEAEVLSLPEEAVGILQKAHWTLLVCGVTIVLLLSCIIFLLACLLRVSHGLQNDSCEALLPS